MYEIFKADNTKLNDRYIWHWLKSDFFNSIVINNQEGGVRTCFSLDKFFKTNMLITNNLVEQEKIGYIFDILDKTIDLHQRKLSLTKGR